MFDRTFEEVLRAHGSLGPPRRTALDLTLYRWALVRAASSQAKAVGERNERYLIVDVLDQKHFQSLSRNRDLWADKDVKDFIKNQFIFMQVSCASRLAGVAVGVLALMHALVRWAEAAAPGCPSWIRTHRPARCSCSSTPPAAFRTRPSLTRGPVRRRRASFARRCLPPSPALMRTCLGLWHTSHRRAAAHAPGEHLAGPVLRRQYGRAPSPAQTTIRRV